MLPASVELLEEKVCKLKIQNEVRARFKCTHKNIAQRVPWNPFDIMF